MVLVPVGGGGLIAGVSAAIKLLSRNVRIIGIEPEGAPSMYNSLKENKAVHLDKV